MKGAACSAQTNNQQDLPWKDRQRMKTLHTFLTFHLRLRTFLDVPFLANKGFQQIQYLLSFQWGLQRISACLVVELIDWLIDWLIDGETDSTTMPKQKRFNPEKYNDTGNKEKQNFYATEFRNTQTHTTGSKGR